MTQKKNKTYNYFVSFVHDGGTAMIQVHKNSIISEYGQLIVFAREIEKQHNMKNVTITNFILLNK